MNILITGATGFIGKNLLSLLITKGLHVYCIARDVNKLLKSHKTSRLVQPIEGDLLSDSAFVKLPKSVDAIIHLAAVLGEWDIEEQKIMEANVEIVDRLLEWFSLSNCKHFIYCSTPGVQGFGNKLAKETDHYNPRGIYEKTKVLAEGKIKNYNFKSGQKWTIIRPDFVYGPGDMRRIKLYKRIKKGQWIKIGKGKSVLRPTHVYDVCVAVFMCLENPKSYFQIFNVGGPELVTTDYYVETIAKNLGTKLFPFRLPTFAVMTTALILERFVKVTNTKPLITKSQVEFLTQDHGTDISKIKDMLGFTPTIDLCQGMKETLNWAKDQDLL